MASIEHTLANAGKPEELGPATGPGNAQDSAPAIVESSLDMSWTEFCSALQVPAFLLAITGFADL